ncbi:MAG: YfcE family phosphodiesterase [Candidatus Falkowbacteria bacterium]|nr:MAG: YfcE family phosphodiesterase [Candidatus Falkowbacteria bacterium]
MLVAIISDIHDNLLNLTKCLDWCKDHKIKEMICCGDVCDADTLKFLANNFAGKIYLVEGNGETFSETDLKTLKNIKYYGLAGNKKIGGLNLGFCHQHKDIKKITNIGSQALDFIFFGHSHKPWLEKQGPTFLANPGNISGTFFQATFAVLETDYKKLDLKILAHL